jgi:hypothetical protein
VKPLTKKIFPPLLKVARAKPPPLPACSANARKVALLKRAIIDLKMKDCSYNEIVDHFARVSGQRVSKEYITRTILEAGARAAHLSGIYDTLALRQVKVLEVDEVFQGKQNCFLGAADKMSAYLFLLAPLPNLDAGTFAAELGLLARHACQLELVVTDGRKAYRSVVPSALGDAAHLHCQVHACRSIMGDQDAYNQAAKKARTKLRKLENTLNDAQNDLRNRRRQLRRLELRLAKRAAERDAYYEVHGIRPRSKKMTWTPAMIAFKVSLNDLHVRVRSRMRTIKGATKCVAALKHKIPAAEQVFKEKKQASLQAGRLVARFKRLLACPPARFGAERAHFGRLLDQSSLPIAPRIRKFVRDNPHLFATKSADLDQLCPPRRANTNTMEGIFGGSRALLDKARHFGDTPLARAIFVIFRFRRNLSPPYTGPHNRESPLERCNVRSKYANYLDALFPLPGENPEVVRPELLERSKKNLTPELQLPELLLSSLPFLNNR